MFVVLQFKDGCVSVFGFVTVGISSGGTVSTKKWNDILNLFLLFSLVLKYEFSKKKKRREKPRKINKSKV